jgi:hypothetical protein
MERIREASPRLKARIAGVFYLLAVLTAVSGETFFRGRLSHTAGLTAVACFVVVTLAIYSVFEPVNRGLSLLAVFSNLVGLGFEALRLNPWGVDIAMAFHGLYCLVIGYLAFRSTFLPRIPGALMAFAGLAWMTTVLSPLAKYLSPYNVALGFLGEGSLMLWLLVMGVDVQRWKER